MRKVKEIGPGKWTQISAFLPQKTAVQCSNRWLSVSSVDEICAHKRAVWTKRSIQSGASTDQYKKQKLDIDAITIELLGGRKVK